MTSNFSETSQAKRQRADPGLSERVAEAMFKAVCERVLQDAAKSNIDPEHIARVFQAAHAESDRAASLLVAALCDDILGSMFKSHLRLPKKRAVEDMLRPSGLLGTADSRMKMAAALGWITPQTYADIDLIRKIRNIFAHKIDASSFDHPSIGGLVTAMSARELSALVIVNRQLSIDVKLSNLRHMFLGRAVLLVFRLVVECVVFPIAQRNGTSGVEVLGSAGFDGLPEDLRQMQFAAVDILFSVIPELAIHSAALNSLSSEQ